MTRVAIASIACVSVFGHLGNQFITAKLHCHCPRIGLIDPHQGRLKRDLVCHAHTDRSGQRLQGVVAAIRVAGVIRLAHAGNEDVNVATPGDGASIRHEDEVAAGYKCIWQAITTGCKCRISGERRVADLAECFGIKQVVVPEAVALLCTESTEALSKCLTNIKLDAMTLAVVKTDRFNTFVTLQCPNQACRRVLSA